MKKLILISTIFFLGSSVAFPGNSGNIPGQLVLGLEEEAYINDIPFDTREVAFSFGKFPGMAPLPEERQVNDIPFDTEKIAMDELLKKIVEQDEEPYVDDISFDTENLAAGYQFSQLVNEYREEETVNDIPFSTEHLAAGFLFEKNVVPGYKTENPVGDITFNTNHIASSELFDRSLVEYSDEPEVKDLPFDYGYCFSICQVRPGTVKVELGSLDTGCMKDHSDRMKKAVEKHFMEFESLVRELEHEKIQIEIKSCSSKEPVLFIPSLDAL